MGNEIIFIILAVVFIFFACLEAWLTKSGKKYTAKLEKETAVNIRYEVRDVQKSLQHGRNVIQIEYADINGGVHIINNARRNDRIATIIDLYETDDTESYLIQTRKTGRKDFPDKFQLYMPRQRVGQ